MLRRATQADTQVMALIHTASFAAPDAWSAEVFSLQLTLPGVFGLLHPSGGMILVRVAADEAEILTVAIAPSARRAGIATILLLQATIQAAAMGAVMMFLEVSETNTPALRLYTASGFRQVGRRPRYYSDMSDALVLRLDLPVPN